MEIEIMKEYRLSVVKTIWENNGQVKAPYKKAGSTLLVNEVTFNTLCTGGEITTPVLIGMGEYATVKYDASNFGPTVEVTEKRWYTTEFSPVKRKATRKSTF
jgi:hypothetical protein